MRRFYFERATTMTNKVNCVCTHKVETTHNDAYKLLETYNAVYKGLISTEPHIYSEYEKLVLPLNDVFGVTVNKAGYT